MKIFNVRIGFATNSSSTHSVVLINDDSIDSIKSYSDPSGEEFGWNDFILTHKEDKRAYFGQVVKHNIARLYNLPEEEAAIIASNWVGAKVDPEGYIDHQSQIILPVEYNSNGEKVIIRKYADQFLNYLLQDKVVICGGNDNEESLTLSTLPIKEIFYGFIRDNTVGNIIGRYSESSGFWTLFNKSSGRKIRMSFYDDSIADNSDKPELVDVKITGFCNKGCSFCYQSSTKAGKAADYSFISRVATELSDLGVFEVALGGGEPTSHPDFIGILNRFNKKNIIPNFSTRNVSWVITHINDIKDIIGAIGISVDSAKEIKAIASKFEKANIAINPRYYGCQAKIMFQVVVGCCSDVELTNILKESKKIGVPVLLLGWKNVGFGVTGQTYNFELSSVLDGFMKQHDKYVSWDGPSVSFDSALVEKEKEWLSKHSMSAYWTLGEGTHSMYIDCVENKMGKSSFGTEFTEIDEDLSNIETFFKKH